MKNGRLATSRLTSHTKRIFQGKTDISKWEGAIEPQSDERNERSKALIPSRLSCTFGATCERFALTFTSLSLETSSRVTCESTCSKSRETGKSTKQNSKH